MKLVVTCRNILGIKQTYQTIRKVFPHTEVKSTGFRGVFLVEVNGDPIEAARKLNSYRAIGRAVPILVEVPTALEEIEKAALKVSELIKEGESFCFRIKKRGKHGLEMPTPEIERKIGRRLQEEISKRLGKKPEVELENPDVIILAEVLGETTGVGLLRLNWIRR